jgi:hypothetical protein
MAVTVLTKARTKPEILAPEGEPVDWVRLAACGSLVCGSLLLLSGRRRAGLVAAASGTALALLEHEDSIRRWWDALPRYMDQAHLVLNHVQDVVEKVAEKGQSLRRALER